jgi:hypothetical protein
MKFNIQSIVIEDKGIKLKIIQQIDIKNDTFIAFLFFFFIFYLLIKQIIVINKIRAIKEERKNNPLKTSYFEAIL